MANRYADVTYLRRYPLWHPRDVQDARYGGVAEWSKAAVLKTVEPRGSVGSNPTASAMNSFRRLSSRRNCFSAERSWDTPPSRDPNCSAQSSCAERARSGAYMGIEQAKGLVRHTRREGRLAQAPRRFTAMRLATETLSLHC